MSNKTEAYKNPFGPAANKGLKEMTKAARDVWCRANPGKTPRPLGWKTSKKKETA